MWRIESFTKVVFDKDECVRIPYGIMKTEDRHIGFDMQLDEVTEGRRDHAKRRLQLIKYFKENGVPATFVSKSDDGKYLFNVAFNVEDDKGFFKNTQAIYEFQHKDVMEFKEDH